MNDTRYCHSVGCSWHGPIHTVGKTEPRPKRTALVGGTPLDVGGYSLPCCPFCGSMLFEIPTKEQWDEGAKQHEAEGHTNYVDFLSWTRGQSRCWPTLREAAVDFEKATGRAVKWDL